jgi:hypothetical protein
VITEAERPTTRIGTETLHEEVLHECASCRHKNRVYLSAPTGTQTAAVWRCGKLSQKTQREVIVQPHENCFEHRSLSDYWEQTNLALVR